MYKEVHTVSHTRTRLKGDHIVNSAINATIQRESEYTHKKSTCIEAETVYKVALESNTTLGQVPNFTGAQAGKLKHKFSEDVTNSVKAALNVERRQKWEEHVKSLTVQGHNLALAAAERQDLVWKSFMYDLKQGTLKFLLNAGIDTLPTAANLKRWKKSPSDLCKLCRCRQTTDHVLSNCKMALDSGRYTWRHKYSHFATDIIELKCKVNCFEVSTKGFLNTRNHSTLNELHKFVKNDISRSQFKSNISALCLTASYHIFLCKDEPVFQEPPYLLPPLVTKKATASM